MKLFPTQEVGSLSRAPFLKKITEKSIEETKKWGELLRVEELDKLLSILNKKRINEDDMIILYDYASLFAIRFFESAGLDVIWDGEQKRVEMYEHPLRYVEGFTFLGTVKVWDAEFYRKGAFINSPKLVKPYHLDEFLYVKSKARREIKIPLTGPYTLADWSFDEYYIKKYLSMDDILEARLKAKEEMTIDIAKNIIRPNIISLVEAGAYRIQIDEPAVTSKPWEVPVMVEALNESIKGVNVKVTLHVCYSDYTKLFPHIAEAKIHQISIECANRDTREMGINDEKRIGYGIIEYFREYTPWLEVAPGVIDVHTDFIEPPELVRDRLVYSAKKHGDESKIITCNDCGLRTRSWPIAYQKEKNMVEGANLARKLFS
ncbi:MAG: hypothetical protein NZ929_06830 [Aigarchaeota archaeon]|nr:hypothetical protein [Aigarchaeota archaeon]MCX8192521.1 hypothetical protein [Nitrososphaeria archaeon]MDW7985743.1 hypothetical protein [Nitrososphaerota archaeon]